VIEAPCDSGSPWGGVPWERRPVGRRPVGAASRRDCHLAAASSWRGGECGVSDERIADASEEEMPRPPPEKFRGETPLPQQTLPQPGWRLA